MIVKLKTQKEIDGFRKAGKAAAHILSKLLLNTQAGWTPIEIDKIAREECDKIEAKPAFLGYRDFPAAICFSRNNVLVHGIPDNKPLERGEIVSIDFGIDIGGFIGDTAETITVGEKFYCLKGKDEVRIISSCRFALFKAIQAAVPGNRLSDIGLAVKKVADESGYKIPENYGGHGLDYEKLHAPPFVSNVPDYSNDCVLRNGMILAIEPMFIDAKLNETDVSSDGWAVRASGITAHCEHTILVSNNGPEILTSRGLEVSTFRRKNG